MILLLGGTSETAEIAESLAGQGRSVLVSTATGVDLEIGSAERIERRCGPLDEAGLKDLIRSRGIAAIAVATHPYAAEIRTLACSVGEALGVPVFVYDRPGAVNSTTDLLRCSTHQSAAEAAFRWGVPVLLTIGTRNLLPYVEAARTARVPLVARVLPVAESLALCAAAGLCDDEIVAARGPFTTKENRALLDQHGIGVLVTKDSGRAGGVVEKLDAARQANCRVVLVARPQPADRPVFHNTDALVRALCGTA